MGSNAAEIQLQPQLQHQTRFQTTYMPWASIVLPRISIAGGVIGAILSTTTFPQIVKTSGGRIGGLSWPIWTKMFLVVTPKAGAMKTAQYGLMRELKLALDTVINPSASTMIAFGVVGTGFQSAIYNTLIKDMYRIYTGTKPESKWTMRTVIYGLAPGVVWCFGREAIAMGGGLALGPTVKAGIKTQIDKTGVELPDGVVRFIGGFASGGCTAFATQWLHNTTLMAGRMAAERQTIEAPHYTMSSLTTTYKELGPAMFYSNFPQRMCLIAGAVALLNSIDIFHRPELRLFS